MADLLAEMDNLKHMLSNANEEKNIQVAIVQDEVAEKQQVIDKLKSQCVADKEEIENLRKQLAEKSDTVEYDGLRQQIVEKDEEIQRLKAAAVLKEPPQDNDTVEYDSLRQQIVEKDEEIQRLKAAAVLKEPPQDNDTVEYDSLRQQIVEKDEEIQRLKAAASLTEPSQDNTPQKEQRQTALVIRELRMNAERNLAWLSKRIKTKCPDR